MDEKKLLVVRQGTSTQRKQAVKDLIASTDHRLLISSTLAMLYEPDISTAEAQKLLKLILKTLNQFEPLSMNIEVDLDFGEKLITAVKMYLLEIEEAPLVLQAFLRAAGLRIYISSLRKSFGQSSSEKERVLVARCVAVAAQVVGISLTIPLIRAMLNEKQPTVVYTGILVIPQVVGMLQRSDIMPVLAQLVSLTKPYLLDPQFSNAANSALVVLADCANPTGYDHFAPVMDELWRAARTKREKLGYLRTLAAIAATGNTTQNGTLNRDDTLTSTQIGSEISESVLALLLKEVDSIPATANRIFLNVLRRVSPYIKKPELQTEFMNMCLSKFWAPEFDCVVLILSQLPVSASQIIMAMLQHSAFSAEPSLCIRLLSKVCPAKLVLDARHEQVLCEQMALCCTTMAYNLKTLSSAFNSVGRSISPKFIVEVWVPTLQSYLKSPEWEVRANSCRSLAAISPLIEQTQIKKQLYLNLVEELGEEYPEVLAEVMNGICELIECAEAESLLPKLTPILRNRNEQVQEQCIKLVKLLAETNGETVSAREWMQCCFELLELQKSPRHSIRHEATSAFASISAVVGPADVANTLVRHLKSPDRQFRVTTAAAIASVAQATGAFAIVPILLSEYLKDDIVVKHGVLKALSFMAQFLNPNDLRPLVKTLVSVVDDGLVDSNQVHRQTAAAIVERMANACVGEGFEPVFVHFLNELMPSIFETSPHVIERVVEAVCRISDLLGAPYFANYLWAGLFHPARKVRQSYWRLYRTVYQSHAESLATAYPQTVPAPSTSEEEDIRDIWI